MVVGGTTESVVGTTLGTDATTGAATGAAGIWPAIGPGAATLVETVGTPGCCVNTSLQLNTPQGPKTAHAKRSSRSS